MHYTCHVPNGRTFVALGVDGPDVALNSSSVSSSGSTSSSAAQPAWVRQTLLSMAATTCTAQRVRLTAPRAAHRGMQSYRNANTGEAHQGE